MISLDGANGKEEWRYSPRAWVVSSPAVGDVDGDGAPDVVVGAGGEVLCLHAYTGKEKWRYATGGGVYSSPALGSRSRKEPFRRDWPMFRHDPQRTGFYGFEPGPLGVYVGSDDGFLHLVDGRDGRRIDRYAVKFPNLVIQSSTHGPLKFLSSPSLADLDGNGTLEAVFTLVDRVWAVEDLGSTRGPKAESIPENGTRESVKKAPSTARNSFALAQIIHSGGWKPGIPLPEKMLEELTRRARLDVLPEIAPLSLRDDDVTRYPFLYVTGHSEVRFNDEEIRKLKGHLERGGFLFAEACCNSEKFDRSVRAIVAKVFGEGKLAKIAADHPVLSKPYSIRTVTVSGSSVEPDFEGVAVQGRLALLLTRQDYACAWGNARCTGGCIAVDTEDSYRMMTNIILYSLRE